MKTLLTALALFLTLSINAQQYYCIQILSTRNPELLRAEHVAMMPDSAKIEQSGEWCRIMFVYPDYETAMISLHSWQRAHKDAFICTRSREEVEKMIDLFTTN